MTFSEDAFWFFFVDFTENYSFEMVLSHIFFELL